MSGGVPGHVTARSRPNAGSNPAGATTARARVPIIPEFYESEARSGSNGWYGPDALTQHGIQRPLLASASPVYSVVRPPSYLGLLVNALGWALAFRSGVGVLLAALNILPLLARMRAERGAVARAVRRRVRCLLPTHLASDSRALLRAR